MEQVLGWEPGSGSSVAHTGLSAARLSPLALPCGEHERASRFAHVHVPDGTTRAPTARCLLRAALALALASSFRGRGGSPAEATLPEATASEGQSQSVQPHPRFSVGAVELCCLLWTHVESLL